MNGHLIWACVLVLSSGGVSAAPRKPAKPAAALPESPPPVEPEPAPVTPPSAPGKNFQAIAAAVPVGPLLDALQRESFPGVLCISAYSPAGMENADGPLATTLASVLAGQKGLTDTRVLGERNADESAVAQQAGQQGCAHVLRVMAFPADPGTPFRVLFSLRDLDGDEMATTVSTRCLAQVSDGGNNLVEAEGALAGMDLKRHVDKEKLGVFRRRALHLSGGELEGWRAPILNESGLRASGNQLRRMTDDPEALTGIARFEKEDDERETSLTRSYLFALLGPGVGLVAGVVGAAVGAGIGALVGAGNVQSMGMFAVICGACVGLPTGLCFTGVGTGVSAVIGRLVAGAVIPKPEEPLSLDAARRLVLESNLRTAQELEIDHEDLPSRYLPVPRPKDIIKDRVKKLKNILADVHDEGSSGDALSPGGQPSITFLTLTAVLLASSPAKDAPHRWKFQAARAPADAWAAAVGSGPVLVAAVARADEQQPLAGQVKRAVSTLLAARHVKTLHIPVAGASAQAALDAAVKLGCTHVLLAEVGAKGDSPVVNFTVRTAAGQDVSQQRLVDAFAEAPLLAVMPSLSTEKLKRDAATLAFPKYAVHVSMMTMTRDGVPVRHELQLWDDTSKVMGFTGFRKTGPMCKLVDLPPESVSKVCKGNKDGYESWSPNSKMPERAAQLLLLANAYNNRIADILGADTVEFDEEFFPVREIQSWRDKHDRDEARKKRKNAQQDDDE